MAIMATGLLERECTVAPEGGFSTGGQVMSGSDEEFMRVVYERHRAQLESYVVRLTRDRHWAEDIVQAALVRAWRARSRLTQGEAATRSWLFTVAYRIFIDEHRMRSVRPVTLTGQDTAAQDSGDDLAERLTWSVTLTTALSALSEPHRQAIEHIYYLNRTIDETASVLGISSGTVKSRLHYAVRDLRHHLTSALNLGNGRDHVTLRSWLLAFVSSSSPAGVSPVRVVARRPGSRLAVRPGNGAKAMEAVQNLEAQR
jgi:RNA polymerase sigma-70 factor, ECF subfamily